MTVVNQMQPKVPYSVINLSKLTGLSEPAVLGELKSAIYGGRVQVCSIANANGKYYRLKPPSCG